MGGLFFCFGWLVRAHKKKYRRCGITVKDVRLSPLLGASQRRAEVVSSSSDAGVRLIILGYHDFSAGTLSPSQPGLALTGRVEARLLYDLYSVDGGVKLLQKPNQTIPSLF